MGKIADEIFKTLNGAGAHACYCERSTDSGCKCALKDEYLDEAKALLLADILECLPEKQTIEDWHDDITRSAISNSNGVIEKTTEAITNYFKGGD